VKKPITNANTIWFADLIRSDGLTELWIVDEKSDRVIVRTPLDMTDDSSTIEALREALQKLGPPSELRKDCSFLFTGPPVRALLASVGVAHTIAVAGRNQAERKARSLARS
jgi:hypothetical protein